MSEDKKIEVWHEKKDVSRQMGKMLTIMETYFHLHETLHEFQLELQLYPVREHDGTQSEPRIWLTCPNNNLGIHLMLYGVKLENKYGKVSNEDAIDVFAEYMRYYTQNSDKFTFKGEHSKYTMTMKFEISNRSY